MRIGLFSDTYYPRLNGVATSVFMLKENLEAVGHEVYVFTTTDPDAPENEHNVIRIPSIPVKTQRLGTIISPRLYRLVKRLSLDIIHTHTEYTLGIFGRIMARRLEIPFIHTMHTVYEYYTDYIIRSKRLEPAVRAVARKLTAVFCNSADIVVVPTEKTKSLIRSYGVKKDIKVIPTGIPLNKFIEDQSDMKRLDEIRSELGIHPGDKVLISIGRVAYEKNMDELLVGLQEYLFLHPYVILVIVGDGAAKSELEEQAEKLEIRQQVIFAGERPWDEINLYYRLGDIFIGASQSETQGLTYIEALASGLPVVAKEDRCLENVLTNGVNGYLWGDAEGLISAVERLLGNQSILESFSEEATESAQRFSAENFMHAVASVYSELKEDYANYEIKIS